MPSRRADFDELPGRDAAPLWPRVWTVFVVFACVVVGMIVAQLVAAVGLAIYLWNDGGQGDVPNALNDALTDPATFLLLAAPVQLMLGLGAVLPAWLSPVPFRRRLGLTKPVLAWWAYPVVLLGALVPAGLGLFFYSLLNQYIEPDGMLERVYDRAGPVWAVVLVLFLSLSPGLVEELFFRGYMQRRLLQRWPAWLAIGVPAALFALIHMQAHVVVFAFPIGVWLGVLAWRTGSVWPSCLCHAFINAVSSGWDFAVRLADLPPTPPEPVLWGLLAVAGVCFLASVWVVARYPGAVRVERPFPWDDYRQRLGLPPRPAAA
jgi:membrane protease YdiL (CAAX protease family)